MVLTFIESCFCGRHSLTTLHMVSSLDFMVTVYSSYYCRAHPADGDTEDWGRQTERWRGKGGWEEKPRIPGSKLREFSFLILAFSFQSFFNDSNLWTFRANPQPARLTYTHQKPCMFSSVSGGWTMVVQMDCGSWCRWTMALGADGPCSPRMFNGWDSLPQSQ